MHPKSFVSNFWGAIHQYHGLFIGNGRGGEVSGYIYKDFGRTCTSYHISEKKSFASLLNNNLD